MDSCYAGVGHHRGCGTGSKPFMIANNDCEGQEQVTNIPGCCLILTARRECTSDGADYDIFYVVFGGLWDLRGRTLADIKRIEDTVQNEIAEYHPRNGISESLPIEAWYWVKETAEFRKDEHRR